MQNLNIAVTDNDPTLMSDECQLRDGVYAIETSSLRLVWMKYENYILYTAAVMHIFQTLNSAVMTKYDLTFT